MRRRPWRKALQPLTRAAVRGLFRLCVALFRPLPWNTAAALGAALGRASYYLLAAERRRALDHLALAFGLDRPVRARQRIARTCFAHFGRATAETFKLATLAPEQVIGLVNRDALERLRGLVGEGRGLIYVTAHFGNWELLAAAIGAYGIPLTVVAAPVYDPAIGRWVEALRGRFNIATLDRGSAQAARRLLAALKRKEMIGMLIDQDTRVDGVFVPFFGRPAYTPAGPAALALRLDVPVVVGFAVRQPNGRYQIEIEGPLPLARSADAAADVSGATADFTARIEARIRRHPEQWVWMHRRWKTKAARTVAP